MCKTTQGIHKMYSLGYKLYHFFNCCIYTTRKHGRQILFKFSFTVTVKSEISVHFYLVILKIVFLDSQIDSVMFNNIFSTT